MLGLAILLLFYFLGVLAHDFLHVPLPGNVIGLLLLLLALSLKLVKLQWVEKASRLLLKHMMLLFAPVIVGTLALADLIAANWVPLLAATILSTLITLLATAAIAARFTDSASPQEPSHDD